MFFQTLSKFLVLQFSIKRFINSPPSPGPVTPRNTLNVNFINYYHQMLIYIPQEIKTTFTETVDLIRTNEMTIMHKRIKTPLVLLPTSKQCCRCGGKKLCQRLYFYQKNDKGTSLRRFPELGNFVDLTASSVVLQGACLGPVFFVTFIYDKYCSKDRCYLSAICRRYEGVLQSYFCL